MKLNNLTAISPIDGRYRNKTQELAIHFSEYGLIRYRVLMEIEYFIALCKLPLRQLKNISDKEIQQIRAIYSNFDENAAQRIKDIESVTNHDVKAVEYFLREKFEEIGLISYVEFIHFGLTSQDINNTATPYSIKLAMDKVINSELDELQLQILDFSNSLKDTPMLAKTHGQPASPTKVGKEFMVFYNRLERQFESLKNLKLPAKFGGATGNFNAHVVAYPEIDWIKFGNNFVEETLGLHRSKITTQIDHYDGLSEFFDNLKRINTILIDMCRDIWTYISMNYFKQKIKKGEVGSSAMPHKVNPIDFENAEGNLGIANAMLNHLSEKLPISRLQRDLTDSTVLRNVGMPLSHILISLKSIKKGLGKLLINEDAIKSDLEQNWAVVAEAIQTILRRENYPHPYEALKQLTRGNNKITQNSLSEFIDSLNVSDKLKSELKSITPFNYTGKAF